MRFDEFNGFVSDTEWLTELEPVPRLFKDFKPHTEPILWARLVALGQLCSIFVKSEGPAIGISPAPFDGAAMLDASEDDYLKIHRDRYYQMLEDVSSAITVTAPTVC